MSKDWTQGKSWKVAVALLALAGCQHDAGPQAEGETDSGGIDICESDGVPVAGQWDTAPYDWSDANAEGLEDESTLPGLGPGNGLLNGAELAGAGGTAPLAVHAVHMSTGDAMLFHGHRDQFLWKVGELTGSPPDGVPMAFRPLIDERTWTTLDEGTNCGDNGPPTYNDTVTGPLNLFCAGHTQLYDGTVFFAGGDVTGGPCGGGLKFAYLFDPSVPVGHTSDLILPAVPTEEGFAWRRLPDMLVDRWYPTTTMLPDGRILVTSGNSQDPDLDGDTSDGGQTTRIVEVYNPFDERWERVCSTDHGAAATLECETDLDCCDPDGDCPAPGTTCNSTVPSFPTEGWPNYPFIYVLPDGNVFYGGGETPEPGGGITATVLASGQILLTDVNNGGNWAWHGEVFESGVTGGSSVMYAPGKILKSGGPRILASGLTSGLSTSDAEVIDFSGVTATDGSEYASIGSFDDDVLPMENARHYHNLVTVPSGQVVAVSGNTYGNSDANIDDHDYDCNFGGSPIAEMDCAGGCPTLCHDPPSGAPSHCTLPDANLPVCSSDADCATCQGAGLTLCDPGNPGAACAAGEACDLGRCADSDVSCADDSECSGDADVCIRGRCTDPDSFCSEHSDCAEGLSCTRGQVCEAGHCIGFCANSVDCPDSVQVCREVEVGNHGDREVRRVCLDACSSNADCCGSGYLIPASSAELIPSQLA